MTDVRGIELMAVPTELRAAPVARGLRQLGDTPGTESDVFAALLGSVVGNTAPASFLPSGGKVLPADAPSADVHSARERVDTTPLSARSGWPGSMIWSASHRLKAGHLQAPSAGEAAASSLRAAPSGSGATQTPMPESVPPSLAYERPLSLPADEGVAGRSRGDGPPATAPAPDQAAGTGRGAAGGPIASQLPPGALEVAAPERDTPKHDPSHHLVLRKSPGSAHEPGPGGRGADHPFAMNAPGPTQEGIRGPLQPLLAPAAVEASHASGGVALLTQGVDSPSPAATAPLPSSADAARASSQPLADTLSGHVRWMVDHDLGEARIKLDPPQLGSLEIRITMIEDRTYVQFSASQAAARELLESAMPRLKELLGSAGLELGGATVGGEQGRAPGEPAHYRYEPMTVLAQVQEQPLERSVMRHRREEAGRIDLYA